MAEMRNCQNPGGSEQLQKLKRIAVVGPVYPYKGGISHYTGLLVKELKKNCEVKTFSYSLQYPKFMFKKEQRDYGNRTFEIPDADFCINTANPLNWRSAGKKIRACKPDLVIVQWWHPYFAPCYQVLLGALKKIPVYFVCHNVLPHERFPMDRLLTKGTLKKGSFCILHSKLDAADLKKLLPQMPYTRTVLPTYNAFKLSGMDRKTAREKLGLSETEQMILFFGLVREYKGLRYLIGAAPQIVSALPSAKIYVVGDFAGKRPEYDALMSESGVREHFVVRDGYVPDAEIEPYFAAADVCVCPYISATQSAIVQIAFGFGLPVIATEVGGLPEVVTDGFSGYVVPPRDPQALAEKICLYFSEQKEAEFRKNVEQEQDRFSWSHTAELIAEQYGKTHA